MTAAAPAKDEKTEKPEKPIEKAAPARPQEFTDADLVTVLHGWGRLHPTERHFIDRVLFTGGVASNVPYSVAKHWKAGTRPDGKPTEGKVVVHILPNTAREGDYIKATGVQPMAAEKLAALLTGADLDAIFEALGAEKALQIAEGLRTRIAGKPAK